MGSASSTQRSLKATRSQTVLKESTNADTRKDMPQAANIAKDNLLSPDIEDLKKGVATPESTSAVVTAIPSEVYAFTTNPATKTSDEGDIVLAPPVGKDSSIRPSELANVVSPSEAPRTLEAINSQRINIKDPKRSQRVRGKGKGKGRGKVAEALQQDMENVPPPAIRRNAHPRQRRGRGSGRVDVGIGPAPSRGRVANRVGGVEETVQAVNDVTARLAETKVKTRKHGRRTSDTNTDIRAKRQNPRRLQSTGQENVEIPKANILHHVNAADRRLSEENFDRSGSVPGPLPEPENATASSPSSPREETGFPSRQTADTSSLQPLPSSTRRRAKEYFQRRTRERSVDATQRHIRPALVPRSEQEQNEGAVANASGKATGKIASLSDETPDHFAFDPVASPFTPNATSSPKQASPSVQSFSSPTPLPSHGNGKVAPLILPKSSNKSTQLATRAAGSVPQLAPTTSHSIQGGHGLAYTYAGADPAHAHLQAEQMALMRLQAYYNWLAGSTPMTAVGIGLGACEHTEMSGGGGGLSGGVALGRQQGQNHGRGKGQSRNLSGAYAHPKEHVVFSPSDHKEAEVGSRSDMQPDGVQGQTSVMEPGNGAAKWDGKWGLRQTASSGKEIGWSWGTVGVGRAV